MQQRQRWARVGILSLLLALLVGACGSDDDGGPNPITVNLTDDWQGSARSISGEVAGLAATLTQSGRQLTGAVTVAHSPCFRRGTITGSVEDDMFEVRLGFGGNTHLDLAGDVSANEQFISGTYRVVRGGGCTGDSGTFRLERD